jgi:hypothetical protein
MSRPSYQIRPRGVITISRSSATKPVKPPGERAGKKFSLAIGFEFG